MGGAADTLDAPGPTFDAETHYDYNVPFVLRFRSSLQRDIAVLRARLSEPWTQPVPRVDRRVIE
jgi:hypothetical protein